MNNAAIRSALQDFSAGTDVSLSLITDIATNRELRRFAGSPMLALSSNTCQLVIDDLEKTYNDQKIDQARKFLEGFAGFVQDELTKSEINRQKTSKSGPLANQNPTKSRITSARSLYVDGALISIRALGRTETYIYYAIFIGIVDVLSAWQSTRNPTDFGWSLFSISSILWIFYSASLAITFHHLSGFGKSLSILPTGEFGKRSWNAFKASFVASTHILLGIILLIIPGLFLWFRYMFVLQAAVLEGCNTEVMPLNRSWTLSSRVGWSVVKATLMSILTYLLVIVVLAAVLNEVATKTFAYNLLTVGIGSIWGIWLSGIVYCGYRKAAAAISNEKADPSVSVLLEG